MSKAMLSSYTNKKNTHYYLSSITLLNADMNVSTLYKILNIKILVYNIQESNGKIKFRAITRDFDSTSCNGEL